MTLSAELPKTKPMAPAVKRIWYGQSSNCGNELGHQPSGRRRTPSHKSETSSGWMRSGPVQKCMAETGAKRPTPRPLLRPFLQGDMTTWIPAASIAWNLASTVPFPARYDGTSVPHSTSWRRSGSGDETDNGFGHVLFGPCTSFFFSGAADFTDHDDGVGVGIFIEQLQRIRVIGSDHRVAANPNTCGLSEAQCCQLTDSLISQSTWTGSHAHSTFFMNVSGHNADFALSWGDDAGTVGPINRQSLPSM